MSQENEKRSYDKLFPYAIGLPKGIRAVYRPPTDGNLPSTYRDETYTAPLCDLDTDHSDPKKRDGPSAQELADPSSVFRSMYGPNKSA